MGAVGLAAWHPDGERISIWGDISRDGRKLVLVQETSGTGDKPPAITERDLTTGVEYVLSDTVGPWTDLPQFPLVAERAPCDLRSQGRSRRRGTIDQSSSGVGRAGCSDQARARCASGLRLRDRHGLGLLARRRLGRRRRQTTRGVRHRAGASRTVLARERRESCEINRRSPRLERLASQVLSGWMVDCRGRLARSKQVVAVICRSGIGR